MIDLNDMLVFAKVAETQGISPAARALHMPKSRVSRRMAALETALGTRLLERSTRSVRLTEVGNIYYQHCKRVAEEASSAKESVNQMLDRPRGHLRISASVAMGQNLIAPHLGEFMQQYPEIELEINLNNRRVDMIAEGFDLVVRVGQLQDSSLVSKRLGSGKAMLYASPGYLAGAAPLNQVADLVNHRILVMTDASNANQWLLENDDGQQELLAVNAVVSINDIIMLRNVAEGGGGVVLIPSYLAEDSVNNEKLVSVLPEWKTPEFNYYVLYPSHQGLTRKLKVWVDFFADKLA